MNVSFFVFQCVHGSILETFPKWWKPSPAVT